MKNDVIKSTVSTLRAVASTLNLVEVKGKNNLDKLLGCINALETVVQAIESTPGEEEQNGG